MKFVCSDFYVVPRVGSKVWQNLVCMQSTIKFSAQNEEIINTNEFLRVNSAACLSTHIAR